jgi:hypothetical protein
MRRNCRMLDLPEEFVPNSAVIGASRIFSTLRHALKFVKVSAVSIQEHS